jgi:hypothetical protein
MPSFRRCVLDSSSHLSGMGSYFLLEELKSRGWCRFLPPPPRSGTTVVSDSSDEDDDNQELDMFAA